MPPPQNQAAWLMRSQQPEFEIKTAAYTSPKDDQIVIRNHAVSINPVDWIIQTRGTALGFPWLKYPLILGFDVAGEVTEVGPLCTRFRVGDRVLGYCVGAEKEVNNPAEMGFQHYTVLRSTVVCHIPEHISYERASVLPLGISTAACGLFGKDDLRLRLPSVDRKSTSTGQTVLVWGGSSSVGSCAIQLCVSAGYEVITTCSPRNFDYVKSLGADKAFDYNSASVKTDIINTLKAKDCAGALATGSGSGDICMDILADKSIRGVKFVSMATFPLPEPWPTRFVLPTVIYYFVGGILRFWLKKKFSGVNYKMIAVDGVHHNDVGKAIYVDFLGQALEAGTFVPKPDPMVIGKGLESIQKAANLQMRGVSAKKVTVTI